MIPKSGNYLSDRIMRLREHDPEKCELPFGSDHAADGEMTRIMRRFAAKLAQRPAKLL